MSGDIRMTLHDGRSVTTGCRSDASGIVRRRRGQGSPGGGVLSWCGCGWGRTPDLGVLPTTVVVCRAPRLSSGSAHAVSRETLRLARRSSGNGRPPSEQPCGRKAERASQGGREFTRPTRRPHDAPEVGRVQHVGPQPRRLLDTPRRPAVGPLAGVRRARHRPGTGPASARRTARRRRPAARPPRPARRGGGRQASSARDSSPRLQPATLAAGVSGVPPHGRGQVGLRLVWRIPVHRTAASGVTVAMAGARAWRD